ncbi:MAG: amidase [Pseudomonadales bacterium]
MNRPSRHSELCFLTAVELQGLVRRREVSVTEVVDAHLDRIGEVNPTLNAIVTLVDERAREIAQRQDAMLARGHNPGPLTGLPIAHKDLFSTKGIRTTRGSPIFAHDVPDRNALIVERSQAAGAIALGKTNTPEFGAGSHTFNPVFGSTRNPYGLDRTCGGSSGGAAVALAARMLPIADGSDTGGSLRNPAAFCNVVGLRTAPGRVPSWPSNDPWATLGVEGPMARTVDDVALLLSAIAGPDDRSALSIAQPGARFYPLPERDFKGVRLGWSPDAGGLPVEQPIRDVLCDAVATFDTLGARVDETFPDLSEAGEVFHVLRALRFAGGFEALIENHRDRVKQTIIWNVEAGLAMSARDVSRAYAKRGELYHRVREFMQSYEFLLCPVTQVLPFPLDCEYPTQIEGVEMHTYIDWMQICSRISILGLPAISVPAGFSEDGLPVGLQIVGRHNDELGVLQLARAFERATGHWRRVPGESR